jgi:ribose/xylose/arabinose/galactoside ABC-type transport system permease subunit
VSNIAKPNETAAPASLSTISASQSLLSLRNMGLVLFLLAEVAFFTWHSPYFATAGNLSNLLLSVSVIGVMAAVSTLVIVGRGLDLSLGSIVAVTGVVTAVLIEEFRWPWPLGILAGIGVGGLCGVMNGWVIAGLNINPIIATIGTLSVFRGIAFVIKDGQTVLIENPVLLAIGSDRVAGVPLCVWLLLVTFVAVALYATRTTWGRTIYAIGASPKAALIAGIRVRSTRFWMYVVSGMSAGVAGIMLIGQAGTAVPSAGIGYELIVVTAVLLGGTTLAGGEGAVWKTALGVLVIGVLNNGMALLSVPSFYQIIANGALLLVAVALDQMNNKGRTAVAE